MFSLTIRKEYDMIAGSQYWEGSMAAIPPQIPPDIPHSAEGFRARYGRSSNEVGCLGLSLLFLVLLAILVVVIFVW